MTVKYLFNLRLFLLVYLLFCINQPSVAQQSAGTIDSSKVYRDIETYSKKSKFTKFIYRLVFKPASSASKKGRPKLLQLPYRNFERKIIRNIHIASLDPFGYSVSDTEAEPQNVFFKAGNKLHIKTQHITVKNLLLFRNNDPFDSLLVKESERLVRGRNYIAEVKFFVIPAGTTDSVDIYVRILDKWSIIPNGIVSTVRTTVGLTENNFIGFGHRFQNEYTWNYTNGKQAFITNYSVPNIRNSYISALLHYTVDEDNNFNKSLTIDRPFYSPLARWAAGLIISQQFQIDTFGDTVSGRERQDLEFNTQDFWAGKAIKISKGNSEDARTTDAIIAARYLRVRYLRKPDEKFDSSNRFSNEDFYLAGLGISSRKYFRDNYIYNFGVIEDVPVGKLYGITGGYQMRNNTGRSYLGALISSGDYNNWGYLSWAFEYGTFLLHGRDLEQGVFSAGANYFSNLYKIGNWRIRQFIKPQLTLGINRFFYDSLSINNENGIRGFNGSSRGTKKIVLTFQTQSYAPWNVLGFRFGPFLNCSLGMLGDAPSGFKNSPVYSQLGIGALINNKYLVLSDFQLSIAYYPSIPGNGFNIIKFNAYSTIDFGFRDFTFGKPGIVVLQ